MNESNKTEFIEMLSATLDLYGRKLSPGAYSIWFECMLGFDIASVRSAFQEFAIAGGSHAPVPADIVKILQRSDGWVNAEEAWSIVSKALFDESVTVFWTPPMQSAFGVALNLVEDAVAARMAFKEVYTRELTEARMRGEKPVWQVSPGTDKGMREAAVEEALRLGRIGLDYAIKLLPGKNLPLLGNPTIKAIR